MIKILGISVVLLSISMVGLAFNILFKKGGKFPAYQVGHNKDMRKLGITCVKHDEYKCFRNLKKSGGCSGCEVAVKESH